MNRVVLLGAAICLSACVTLPRSGIDFRISNFRQGLIDPDAAGKPMIATEGNDFPYAINGTCLVSGRRLPCMWHGFEFTYRGPDDLNVLTCTVDSSVPFNAVDPTETYGSSVTTFNFSLKLKGRQGRFINPKYKTWPAGANTPWHEVTRCEYREQEVLRFEFTIRVPPNHAFETGRSQASLRSLARAVQRER